MTREEAIQCLKDISWQMGSVKRWQNIEAIDMAIEALSEDKTDGDLISRANAIRWVKTECNQYGKPTLDYDSGLKVIEHLKKMPSELPSAEATQGEWIEVEDYNGDIHYKCDQCGEEWTFPYGTPSENNANFCPNCGARMENKE